MPQKTLEDRVDDFARRWIALDVRQRRALLQEFKEVARDQRHQCAEAVAAAGVAHTTDYSRIPNVEWDAFATADRAHAAVMNAPEPGAAPHP
jgi:hypothetical protein